MASQAALHVLRAVDTAFGDDRGRSESQGGIFIQAASWGGQKPGYVFKTGKAGLGYYREAPLAALQDGDVKGTTTESIAKDANELLEEAEQLAEDLKDLENIDDRGIKRIVAGIERRIRRNQELRLKHADDPRRFLDSELELNELLTKLSALAGEPELYNQLVDQKSVPLLLELLQHENVDVVLAVVELLRDLTDADSVEDLDEECIRLVAAIMDATGIDLLIARLSMFQETSEEIGNAVTAMLTCFQNMGDVDPRVLTALSEHQLLVPWLVDRIYVVKNRKFDENKGLAAEMLATLAQFSMPCRKKLIAEGAMDKLMVTMSGYRKIKKPLKEKSEEEFVLELCNIFSACCIEASGKQQFLEYEGVELMLIMLKNRQFFRIGCIKVLAHATTEFQRTADLCVESKGMPGLPPLFGIFMGKNKTAGVKPNSDDARQQLEGVTSVIANLMHYTKRSNCERVASKFVENEFEKADRLMEVFFQYQRRIKATLDRLKRRDDMDEDEDMDAELREAGHFMLQQMSLIFGYLWGTGDMLLRKRLLSLLHQRKASLATVRMHLESLYSDISQQIEGAHTRMSRVKVAKMIVSMGGEVDLERVFQQPPPSAEAQPPLPESEQPPLPPGQPYAIEPAPPLPDEDPDDEAPGLNAHEDAEMTDAPLPSDDGETHGFRRQPEGTVDDEQAGGTRVSPQGQNRTAGPASGVRNGQRHDNRDLRRHRDRDRTGERRHDNGARELGRTLRERDSGASYHDRESERRERDKDRGRDRDSEWDGRQDGDRRHDVEYARRRERDRDEKDKARDRDYRRDRDREEDARRRRR
eukprot:jgi/Ulvmu1/12900/UM098_0088.1